MKITPFLQKNYSINHTGLAKINFCSRDCFEKKENKKIKPSQLYQQLQKYGLSGLELVKLRILFHKLDINSISGKTAKTLCSIYSKNSDFQALLEFLQTAYDSKIVAPKDIEQYLDYSNELYNTITPNGSISANLASRLALAHLDWDVSDDDINVATFLNNFRANEHPNRKIDEGSAIYIAKKMNSTKESDGSISYGTNIEKLEALCEYYFFSKTKICPKTALLLANMSMSEKNPQKIDKSKFEIIMNLLTDKINSKRLDENELMCFINFSFNQPEYLRKRFLNILEEYYNTEAFQGKFDIEAVIEICKLETDGLSSVYKLLYLDYYNDITRMAARKNMSKREIAVAASEFTRNTPKSLIRNSYYKIDLEKLYYIYGDNEQGLSISLLAEILAKHYSQPNAYKLAEKEIRRLLGYCY